MTDTAVVGGDGSTIAAHSWVWELLLRLVGAALQMAATWAIIHVLTPDEAGVYFRGFVIALGLSTLLRAKYEICMAQHVIGQRARSTGITNGVLLMQLARRVLVRSSLACGALL